MAVRRVGIVNEAPVDVLPHRKNAHTSVACLRLNARKRSYQIALRLSSNVRAPPRCFRKRPSITYGNFLIASFQSVPPLSRSVGDRRALESVKRHRK